MNVPGRKNRVTRVIIFMETVSVFVFLAMSFISLVMCSIFFVDARDSSARILLLCGLRNSRIPCSYRILASDTHRRILTIYQ